MIDVLNLALPYFGLIFLGFLCGKLKRIPDTGLAWLNFFLIYVALPCLFYRILAKTPFDELNNVPFVVATTLGTSGPSWRAFVVGIADAGPGGGRHDRGPRRRLRQYRLHGSGAGARDTRCAGGGAGGVDILLRQYPAVLAGADADGLPAPTRKASARPRSMSQRRSRCIPSSSRLRSVWPRPPGISSRRLRSIV